MYQHNQISEVRVADYSTPEAAFTDPLDRYIPTGMLQYLPNFLINLERTSNPKHLLHHVSHFLGYLSILYSNLAEVQHPLANPLAISYSWLLAAVEGNSPMPDNSDALNQNSQAIYPTQTGQNVTLYPLHRPITVGYYDGHYTVQPTLPIVSNIPTSTRLKRGRISFGHAAAIAPLLATEPLLAWTGGDKSLVSEAVIQVHCEQLANPALGHLPTVALIRSLHDTNAPPLHQFPHITWAAASAVVSAHR